MATFGSIISTADILAKAVRSGSVTLLITDLTKAVTFGSVMPSTSYRVLLTVESNAAQILWPTSKTVNGFTLNASVGVAGTVAYLAIED